MEGETSGIVDRTGLVSLLRPYQGVTGDEKRVKVRQLGCCVRQS